MTDAQAHAFLAAGTRTGKLAVTRRDGSPLVVPIWFVLDGADLMFTTGERSIKGRAMRRDPRVALVRRRRDAAVHIRAGRRHRDHLPGTGRDAPLVDGDRRPLHGRRPGGEFGRRNAVPGEWLVRLTPTRIVTWADVAG